MSDLFYLTLHCPTPVFPPVDIVVRPYFMKTFLKFLYLVDLKHWAKLIQTWFKIPLGDYEKDSKCSPVDPHPFQMG